MQWGVLQFLAVILILGSTLDALRLTGIGVPSFATVGEHSKLVCEFDLEGDRLDSVTWYKDNVEFFKFVKNEGIVQYSVVSGVVVDLSQSTQNIVALKELTQYSSGAYTCKVTAKSTSPKNRYATRNMVVVEPPQSVTISGSKDSYSVGETATVTCYAYGSNPAASISWRINDKQLSARPPSEATIKAYLQGIQDRSDISQPIQTDPFFKKTNSSLRLKFKIKERYVNDGIKLECQAHVGDLYWPTIRKITVHRSSSTGSIFTLSGTYIGMAVIMIVTLN